MSGLQETARKSEKALEGRARLRDAGGRRFFVTLDFSTPYCPFGCFFFSILEVAPQVNILSSKNYDLFFDRFQTTPSRSNFCPNRRGVILGVLWRGGGREKSLRVAAAPGNLIFIFTYLQQIHTAWLFDLMKSLSPKEPSILLEKKKKIGFWDTRDPPYLCHFIDQVSRWPCPFCFRLRFCGASK